ncbi:MAG: type I restriction-modification system subunit M [Methanosphaera stadtmanae]|nr:type I restriction-modification system subunit M [Methanosphaera stadtmanae]
MESINEVISLSSEILLENMKSEEYQQDLIIAIFYKYLSNKIEKENNKKLFKYNINFQEAFDDENNEFYGKKIKEESLKELGYFIKPENLYTNIITNKNILLKMDNAIKEIEFQDKKLSNLFTDINFQNLEINEETFKEVLKSIDSINFKDNDQFNDLMKSLMKKSYTPPEISLLLSKIVYMKNKILNNVYDAACGSCSTLLKLKENQEVINYYGQEFDKTNYTIGIINLIMHDILPKNIHIYHEDSTISQRQLPLMDTIVSHPPFLKKWAASKELLKEKRFRNYKKLPPKSKADFAFIETMIFNLKKDGIMAVAIPQGVLFRANAEKEIRKNFILNNYIDCVIGLPEKIFYKNIPTCIIVFKKNRDKNEDILFIDASQYYEKSNSLNNLRNSDIDRIVETYRNKEEIEKYSHLASTQEILNNDYNLNIKLYVNTYQQKDKIDVSETLEEINKIEKKIKSLNAEQKLLIDQIINYPNN